MHDHTFLNLQITRSDIRPHMKWAVSLVFAYGTLIFLWGVSAYKACKVLMGLQTFMNHGLQILMGPQTFMNYKLQIAMGSQLL